MFDALLLQSTTNTELALKNVKLNLNANLILDYGNENALHWHQILIQHDY